MDVKSVSRLEDVLNPDVNAVLGVLDAGVFNALGTHKGAREHHVGDLLKPCATVGNGFGLWIATVNCKIHVLYFSWGFKLVSEAARRCPHKQVCRRTGLQRLDENLVVVTFDLERRAAGRGHGDRFTE